MKLSNRFVTVVAGLALAGSTQAADLLITPEPMGGNTLLNIEFVNTEGNATAFEFDLFIPGIKAKEIDTSVCGKSLKSHSATCGVQGDRVTYIVFSPNNELLPTAQIGSVLIRRPATELPQVSVKNLVVADDLGNVMAGSTLLVDPSRLEAGAKGKFEAQ